MTDDPAQGKKKIQEALDILRSLNMPPAQQNERSALTLLSLVDLRAGTAWSAASAPMIGITEMMDWFKQHYGVNYAPNTRETVRRQTVHQFRQVGLILENPDKPDRPTNSPKTRYQIEPVALKLIQTYGTPEWDNNLSVYLGTIETLRRLHVQEREMTLIPVRLPNGEEVRLSAGGQNLPIKDIIFNGERFLGPYEDMR